MVPYQVTLGLAAAANGDWRTASSAFEAAAAVDGLPQTWLNLALARYRSDAPADEVVSAIERALRFGDDPGVSVAAAYLLAQLDRLDEARAVVASMLARYPTLGADPLWTGASRLASIFSEAYEDALAKTSVPWELALMAGDVERARDFADRTSDDLAGLVIDAWTGDTDALATLQATAIAHPYDFQTTSWAARASAKAGDGAAATDFRRIIEFTNEAPGRPGFELRTWTPGSDLPAGASIPDSIYGAIGYRRGTPDTLQAPGLPTVVEFDLAQADGSS